MPNFQNNLHGKVFLLVWFFGPKMKCKIGQVWALKQIALHDHALNAKHVLDVASDLQHVDFQTQVHVWYIKQNCLSLCQTNLASRSIFATQYGQPDNQWPYARMPKCCNAVSNVAQHTPPKLLVSVQCQFTPINLRLGFPPGHCQLSPAQRPCSTGTSSYKNG